MTFRLLAATAALLTAACGVGSSDPVAVAIPLDPAEETVRVGELRYCGGLVLDGDLSGLSALDVAPDGATALAMSDRSYLVELRLDYDADGCLEDAGIIGRTRLVDADGARLRGSRGDTEGLARLPAGGYVVSLERRHRLLRYVDDFGRAVAEPAPGGMRDLPNNKGVEALTALPDGRLLGLAEGGYGNGRHDAWIGRGDSWTLHAYLPADGFKPVGATTLANGDVLVLERRFSTFGGFSTRVAHLPAAELAEGGDLRGNELARLEAPLNVDNFEGISAIPGDEGNVRIFIVSDDNSFPLQRTLLMQFLWEPRRTAACADPSAC